MLPRTDTPAESVEAIRGSTKCHVALPQRDPNGTANRDALSTAFKNGQPPPALGEITDPGLRTQTLDDATPTNCQLVPRKGTRLLS